MDLFAGFLMGFLASLFLWLMLTHVVVPKVRFAEEISKTPTTQGDLSGFTYRIKFENAGRRSIIDVEIVARVRIGGIPGARRARLFSIPLNHMGDAYDRIPVILPARKGQVGQRRLSRLHLNHRTDFLARDSELAPLHESANAGTLTLEELLAFGSKTWLEFVVFGYDPLSGSRKMFRSTRFTVSNIREAPYQRGGLGIVPGAPTDGDV